MAVESTSSQPLVKIGKSSYQQKCHFQFEVDHRNARNLPNGHYIRSPAFNCGGCTWILHYYPQGRFPAFEGTSIFLVLLSNKNVILQYQFSITANDGRTVFSDTVLHAFTNHVNNSGFPKFFQKERLDECYCKDGRLHIGCHITVVNALDIQRSGDLREHIMNLRGEVNFDVTFEVEGKHIRAHKLILAARSPVFKASLFGGMLEANKGNIQIKEMKANVFEALIGFMYTDGLTNGSSFDGSMLSNEFLEDVFVAADRYCVRRLRILCEELLAGNLSINTAVSTLILADRHSKAWLKERCFQFISVPKNFVRLVFSDRFLETMKVFPSLFTELCQKMKL